MATDVQAIEANLVEFYDFAGADVLHVGAGGGQLIAYARLPRSVTAVDSDHKAAERLRARVRELDLGGKISVVEGDFSEIQTRADVVFFEFCLHEMTDPGAALDHARSLAPCTLVIDHLPESPWSRLAVEEEKLAASWRAIRERGISRERRFEAEQRFAGEAELRGRLAECGAESMRRIDALVTGSVIRIPMPYGIALL